MIPRRARPLFLLMLLIPATALAQGAGSDHKWEIGVHGGGVTANSPTSGDSHLPGPGATFTTSAFQPSRRTSSWQLGDGALLLNQLAGAFNLQPRVTPLDAVLRTFGAERQGGGSVGVRVGYRITSRFTAEFNVDWAQGPLELTDAMRDGIEASHPTVRTVMNAILVGTGGPFTNVVSTSSATFPEFEKARQTFMTGAVNFNLLTGGFVPYVTFGGGKVSQGGELPSVTIVENYQFRLFGVSPFNETDTVTLRYVTEDSGVIVFGGGVKYDVSSRFGVRGEVRALFYDNKVSVLMNASPVVATTTPSTFIASGTNPSLQFSNNPISGQQSTLSGPAITDFTTFAGSGTVRHVNIAGGVYVRF
jgi:hypothetical protein